MQLAENVEMPALTFFWKSRKLTHISFARRRDIWLDQRWRDGDYSSLQNDEGIITACFLGMLLTLAGILFIGFAPYEPEFMRSGMLMMGIGLPVVLSRTVLLFVVRRWVRRHGARRVACSTPLANSSVRILGETPALIKNRPVIRQSPFSSNPQNR